MSVEGMLPSIEVAKKLAQVKAIEQLPAPERQTLLTVVDSLLRDASARKTYSTA